MSPRSKVSIINVLFVRYFTSGSSPIGFWTNSIMSTEVSLKSTPSPSKSSRILIWSSASSSSVLSCFCLSSNCFPLLAESTLKPSMIFWTTLSRSSWPMLSSFMPPISEPSATWTSATGTSATATSATCETSASGTSATGTSATVVVSFLASAARAVFGLKDLLVVLRCETSASGTSDSGTSVLPSPLDPSRTKLCCILDLEIKSASRSWFKEAPAHRVLSVLFAIPWETEGVGSAAFPASLKSLTRRR
mmetsp:Transcript_4095/g.6484  ORF Transcript_4095/g.6484 Transcript_4095/m.6484 type:complete len:249 (+) Transcript_4095:1429-2175(+)